MLFKQSVLPTIKHFYQLSTMTDESNKNMRFKPIYHVDWSWGVHMHGSVPQTVQAKKTKALGLWNQRWQSKEESNESILSDLIPHDLDIHATLKRTCNCEYSKCWHKKQTKLIVHRALSKEENDENWRPQPGGKIGINPGSMNNG